MSAQSPGAKFVASLLSGAVESIARAGAKAIESIAADAEKALKSETAKVTAVRQGAELWRKMRLGDDLPSELQDDPPVAEKKEKVR